jgi:hypothetical protein
MKIEIDFISEETFKGMKMWKYSEHTYYNIGPEQGGTTYQLIGRQDKFYGIVKINNNVIPFSYSCYSNEGHICTSNNFYKYLLKALIPQHIWISKFAAEGKNEQYDEWGS